MQAFLDVNHVDDSFEQDVEGRWPFHSFFEQLILEMFDPGESSYLKPFNFPFFLGWGWGTETFHQDLYYYYFSSFYCQVLPTVY